MPRLLITRPEIDARPLADRLAEMGIESFICPLLNIEFHAAGIASTDDLQAFLLTSANGARALARVTDVRDVPVFAVGDATARAAHDLGFKCVESADGDVHDLADLVAGTCDPSAGALLHAAGSARAGDLAADLGAHGFQVRRVVLYSATVADHLPVDVIDQLKSRSIDGILVYSPRTARILDTVLAGANCTECVRAITLFCLSDAVNKSSRLEWGQRVVADVPTQESLLDAVRTCYY